nr:MAG TPA: hypothetical protein [Caudoviricetes sp.]DAQ95333.1 MAG TPA: hypothetical protein [Caudoviricetes sp.]
MQLIVNTSDNVYFFLTTYLFRAILLIAIAYLL